MPGKVDIRNTDFDFYGDGIFGTATKNSTTDFDYKIPLDDIYINGGEVTTKDSTIGDCIKIQIVDRDNILGYGANTVLKTYLEKWYINPNGRMVLDVPYAGQVPKNLYLRVKYTSTGTDTDVKIAVNYFMHIER